MIELYTATRLILGSLLGHTSLVAQQASAAEVLEHSSQPPTAPVCIPTLTSSLEACPAQQLFDELRYLAIGHELLVVRLWKSPI